MPRSFPWSDLDDDKRSTVLLIGGISAVILLAFALIGYGYYTEKIAPKHEAVLTVGNRTFDYSYIEKRVLWDFGRGLIDPQNLQQSIGQTISSIQNEEISRQTGKRLGVSVTEDEITKQMSLLVTGRFSSEDPDPTGTLREGLRGAVVSTGLSVSDFRDMAIANALNDKTKEQFAAAIPAQLPHSNMRLIMTAAEAGILQAKQEYQTQLALEGKPDTALGLAASKFSEDPSKAQGGEKNWVPKGALPPEVEAVAFTTIGISDVIQASDGYYMVSVRDIQTQDVTKEDKDNIVARSVKDATKQTQDAIGGPGSIVFTDAQAQRLLLALQQRSASA